MAPRRLSRSESPAIGFVELACIDVDDPPALAIFDVAMRIGDADPASVVEQIAHRQRPWAARTRFPGVTAKPAKTSHAQSLTDIG